jgi:flagellar biosynthetic protein FlhB
MAGDTDDSERTEEPTQRRLEEAAKHGDIVKSQEVTTFILLGAGTLAVALFGHSSAQSFANGFEALLEQPDQFILTGGGAMDLMRHALWGLLLILGPPLGLMMGAGLAANVLQHRPVFTAERLKPDLAKLSPISGFKRMFGTEGLLNLVKGLAKIAVVGFAVWNVLWPERGRIVAVLDGTASDIASDMVQLTLKLALATLAVLAVIAGLDYFMQRFQFLKRNRMSRQEIKEEFRQTEGDPAVKAKVRQLRQERSRRRMMAAVPEATVVIMNPTHYAVALKYEAGVMAAPVCVAKGVDALALRIRDVAREHEVPVVENPPLARALYAAVEIDEAVPPEHYKAVAQVIGFVMRVSGKMRAN